MSGAPLVLYATVRLHGRPVMDLAVSSPERLQVGRGGPVVLPMPSDVPWLLRAGWQTLRRVRVEVYDGTVHEIGEEEQLVVDVGPVQVELRLGARVTVRRTVLPAVMALSWFVIVLAVMVSMGSELVFERVARCTPVGDMLGLACPTRSAGGDGGLALEVLERMLKKDYEGGDEGEIVRVAPDVAPEKEAPAYMPAGDAGPITERGGAEQVAATPRRQAQRVAKVKAAPKRTADGDGGQAAEDGVAAVDGGAPKQAEGEADDADGLSPEDDDADLAEAGDGRAEEKQGWGVRDWFDAAPKADRAAVDNMVRRQKTRLRVDPDDIDNIGLLAYYQYLQEDYEAAEKSFDRVIELNPESSAGYNNKALVYKRRGEFAREEGLYRLALAMEPDETTAMNNLAVCLAHQGRFADALAIMDKLERIDPNDPYAWLHRSKILAAKGDDEAALVWMRRALEGVRRLDLMHHIEFRQDVRLDPAFVRLRADPRLVALLEEFYGADSPVGPRR